MTRSRGGVWGFPRGFFWGAATSAYQIEGATAEDGRGPSIWDTFARRPGAIADGSDGSKACDHYHRYREDVALMAELGLGAYRFSIAWPRVIPEGAGPLNEDGLDFYDRLVDALLAAGIQPFPTLYHWDLPQALQERGGWASRQTVEAFARFAEQVGRRLGDRVRHWFSHNEPFCAAILGHESGVHAPGIQDPPTAYRAAHHLLLSHGRAVEVLRATVPRAQLGIALLLTHVEPATSDPADAAEARFVDGLINRWYLDPLHGRGYPGDVVEALAQRGKLPRGADFVRDGDLQTIAAATDFVGVNYYRPAFASAEPGDEGARRRAGPALERTDMGWEIFPEGLYRLLVRLQRDYSPQQLLISENGAAFDDEPGEDGEVHDPRRQAYLRGHLQAAHRAIADGVPLAGYFAWSLLDNFEWGFGFGPRFGLLRVDYGTQQRTVKQSGRWYAGVIRQNALPVATGERTSEQKNREANR